MVDRWKGEFSKGRYTDTISEGKRLKMVIASNNGVKSKCGADKLNGTPCMMTAGHGTDHLGVGRCNDHSVIDVTPTDTFNIPSIKERMWQFQNDKEIMSLDREIALLRAWLETIGKLIDIAHSELSQPGLNSAEGLARLSLSIPDLTNQLNQTTRNLGRLVMQKHEIEVGRKLVIDIRSVSYIFRTVGSIIDTNVIDADVRAKILKGLAEISLPIAEM